MSARQSSAAGYAAPPAAGPVPSVVIAGTASQPRQNWILDPAQDALFIIVAPLLVLGLALAAFHSMGAADAAALVILAHMVLTVAHHLPTFIRIYGDVELFRRFKWSFLLGPLVPLAFATCVLVYMNARQVPVENFLYLFVLLALWDPYHFLMQHYGFMRIYDRPNLAPRRLAARMDLALCVSWFAFIMLASTDWLVGILDDLYTTARLPAYLAVPAAAVPLVTCLMQAIASGVTVGYGMYLLWCRRLGYFISWAKLALFAITFGVMYLAYTPNPWIRGLAPGWSFKVGFAAVGIVHMTQYLAIVWRYDRSLAARPGRSRPGLFTRLHARGGLLIGVGYVLLCLSYGELLTGTHGGRLLMSVVMALGFTSTLLHYYFDGFIWKVRHQQNRENLAPDSVTGPAGNSVSWWSSGAGRGPGAMLLRQTLYFAVPMAVLTAGAVMLWTGPGVNYLRHMAQAQTFYQQGQTEPARAEARLALDSMDRQLPFARRLAALQPTSAREAALAILLYNRARYRELLLPTLDGQAPDAAALERYRAGLDEAVAALDRAIRLNGPLGQAGNEKMTEDDARRLLDKWRAERARLQA
ncbi:MAG: hypothetical protein P4L83_03870 [Nevskia sp.]|nr:hypothetical protein [Nevskia sp.]